MTYKAKSLIYLGVFACLALTYHFTDKKENEVQTYAKTQEIKKATEANESTTVGIDLEERE